MSLYLFNMLQICSFPTVVWLCGWEVESLSPYWNCGLWEEKIGLAPKQCQPDYPKWCTSGCLDEAVERKSLTSTTGCLTSCTTFDTSLASSPAVVFHENSWDWYSDGKARANWNKASLRGTSMGRSQLSFLVSFRFCPFGPFYEEHGCSLHVLFELSFH